MKEASETISQWINGREPQKVLPGGEALYQCPLCKKNQRLQVNKRKGVWHCHKCGLGGRLPKTGKESSALLEGEFFEESGSLEDYSPITRDGVHWKYLTGRGLKPHVIFDLHPHYGPVNTLVYFPLYRPYEERPCYFTGRSILQSATAPYHNPAEGTFRYKKSELLWGLHRSGREFFQHIILCEGIFDAVWQPDGLALMGKSISPSQVETLKGLGPIEITILLDGDAHEEAYQIACHLNGAAEVISTCLLPSGKDPDDYKKSFPHLRARERVG